MNQKAQLFQDTMEQLNISSFQMKEMPGEMHPVVFYSHLNVADQQLRVQVIVDDSRYVIVRIYVAEGVVTGTRKYRTLKLLNGFNKDFKLFKFYVDDEKNIVFDCNLTFDEGTFNMEMVSQALWLAQEHLKREYTELMKNIIG